MFTAIDSFGIEARLAGYVDEANTKRSAGDRGWETFGSRSRFGVVGRAGAKLWSRLLRVLRKCTSEHVVERKNQRCAGERSEKCTTRPSQNARSPSLGRRCYLHRLLPVD